MNVLRSLGMSLSYKFYAKFYAKELSNGPKLVNRTHGG
jgi:hypothetical protein